MKVIFFALLLISTSTYSQTIDKSEISQKEVNKLISEISKIIKNNSLFVDSLNWTAINEAVKEISIGIKSNDEFKIIYKYFTEKLRSVGDKHSFFLTKDFISKIQNKTQETKQAESKYLENGIGYIKVPGCMTMDTEKDKEFANNIRRLIQKVDLENKATYWVIDLRHNTGGNMWPMIAGLNALTEDGIVGYSISPFHKKEIKWKSYNGEITYSKKTIDTYKIKNTHSKIAILIDSMTASSGEMTAISFSGLQNVRIFGVPSAGYTTSNSTYYLSNGTQFYLAASYVADRNHKKFLDKIVPDVIVNSTDKNKDETLEVAKMWLRDLK